MWLCIIGNSLTEPPPVMYQRRPSESQHLSHHPTRAYTQTYTHTILEYKRTRRRAMRWSWLEIVFRPSDTCCYTHRKVFWTLVKAPITGVTFAHSSAQKLQHGIEREKCGMEGGSRGPSQGSELNACSQDSWRSEASTWWHVTASRLRRKHDEWCKNHARSPARAMELPPFLPTGPYISTSGIFSFTPFHKTFLAHLSRGFGFGKELPRDLKY